jgi:hypothetical protein
VKSFFILLLIASAIFAGDESEQDGVTSPCWINRDGSYSFTEELVKTLSSGIAKGKPCTYLHHGGKTTMIYYNPEKHTYRVVKNFVLIPPVADTASEVSSISDSISEKQETEYEVRWNPVTKKLDKVPKK